MPQAGIIEIDVIVTFTTLWANSADDKMTFFWENWIWYFMQIVFFL